MQEADQHFLHDNDIQTINDEDKEALDDPLTMDEIAQTIKALPNNKTQHPGSDGIPVEFYKIFWIKIKEMW